jgi:hypothetical protein
LGDKPYKLRIMWSDFVGNEKPEWIIPANTFYVALVNETNKYKQLSKDWITIFNSIRPDKEQIQLYFRWDLPEVAYDQRYSGTYNWSVVPSTTAKEYAEANSLLWASVKSINKIIKKPQNVD